MTRSMNMYQQEMLRKIDAISLALQDTVLFLDTHPENKEALAYFDECSKMRNDALAAYAKEYGPLIIDDVTISDVDYWNWINQPWPWEEGGL
ncbi:MAG: spore coat protein CotJB [Eubacteriales bacterium]